MKGLILCGDGLNCEVESQHAMHLAGIESQTIHVRDLFQTPTTIHNFDFLFFIGGFSFGDHLGAGNALAKKIEKYCLNELLEYIESGKLILGVCNGFQVLVKLGLFEIGSRNIALARNQKLNFETRSVNLRVPLEYQGFWFKPGEQFSFPIRHGEGRFYASDDLANCLLNQGQVALQYCTEQGIIKSDYPINPNGSVLNIAALQNPKGNVLAMMPHPEAYLFTHHHPLYHELDSIGQNELSSQYPYGWKIIQRAAKHYQNGVIS